MKVKDKGIQLTSNRRVAKVDVGVENEFSHIDRSNNKCNKQQQQNRYIRLMGWNFPKIKLIKLIYTHLMPRIDL